MFDSRTWIRYIWLVVSEILLCLGLFSFIQWTGSWWCSTHHAWFYGDFDMWLHIRPIHGRLIMCFRLSLNKKNKTSVFSNCLSRLAPLPPGMLASAQQGHWRRDVERLAKMAMFSERQGALRAVCQSCCEGDLALRGAVCWLGFCKMYWERLGLMGMWGCSSKDGGHIFQNKMVG